MWLMAANVARAAHSEWVFQWAKLQPSPFHSHGGGHGPLCHANLHAPVVNHDPPQFPTACTHHHCPSTHGGEPGRWRSLGMGFFCGCFSRSLSIWDFLRLKHAARDCGAEDVSSMTEPSEMTRGIGAV
ncbi:hypothetical protein CRG98_015761 [Punica granatum]|uniref:Uncharacterized protein n=1 Tax=Punica granatum TaxID=22663 RepID=A0A2I0K5F6_PUNGR|nr:hypothetical protein CRG98_015761 [Punica granatum]